MGQERWTLVQLRCDVAGRANALPFYAAAKAAEVIGAASMVQARQNLRLLGDADWHRAALGFEIANEGADGIQRFLGHAIARGSLGR